MLRTSKQLRTAVALLSIFIIGWAYSYDDIFIRVTLLVFFLILFSFFWALFSASGLDIFRKSRYSRLMAGEFFEEKIEVINRSPFWHLLLEISDLTIEKSFRASRVISSIGPYQSRFYHSRQYLEKRGIIYLGPIKISTSDPFKLFYKEKRFERRNRLYILPYYEQINPAAYHFGQLSGGVNLQHPSLETTTHAAGIREYQPGDPLNRIHWPGSMKRNRLIVKEFDQNPQGSVWIFLDAQKGINVGINDDLSEQDAPEWHFQKQKPYHLPRDSFEYAVSITASLANYFILQGRQVGFCHSGKRTELIPAEKGERQISKILDLLCPVQEDGDIPLFPFIESNISYQNPGNMIILITSSKAKKLNELADLLRRKALNPLFIILDTHSFDNQISDGQTIHQLKLDNIPTFKFIYGNTIKNILQDMNAE
jgi:uncharacterized protein (DUF58 family)